MSNHKLLSSLCAGLVRGSTEFQDLGEDMSYFALSSQISPLLSRIRSSLKQSVQRIRNYTNGVDHRGDLSFQQIEETSEDLFEQLNIRMDALKKSKKKSKLIQQPTSETTSQPASISIWPVQNSYHLFVPLRTHKYKIDKFTKPSSELYSELTEEIEINEVQTALIELFRSKPHLYSQVHFPGSFPLIEYQPFQIITNFPHPYLEEISQFQPTSEMLKVKRMQKGGLQIPVMPSPLKSDSLQKTPLHYIDTVSDFQSILVPALNSTTELAVDLEHHHINSYLGKTCLMQLSTRSADFIVDTLALRPQIMKLASVFQNPFVVKVFHGADSDMMWLQRDFGIYVVNLFDTGRASRLLQFTSHSYAFLLQYFCKVKTDKSYQLADWRVRPLTQQMMKYARTDTHYLLYIYDCMKVELERKGQQNSKPDGQMLLHAWQQSAHVALRVYSKPRIKDQQYQSLVDRNRTLLNPKLLKVLKLMLKWRDWVARRLDLNPHTLLKNSSLFRIVKQANSTYADLEHILTEGCPALGSHSKQYTLDLFQRLQAKLRGKKPQQSQLVSDLQSLSSPALKPVQIAKELESTRSSFTFSQRGSLLGATTQSAHKSEVMSYLVKRLQKATTKKEKSKFTQSVGLKDLMEEQMKKLKKGLEQKRELKEKSKKIPEETKLTTGDIQNYEQNDTVQGDVISFASELPTPLKVVEPKRAKKLKMRKAEREEEPEILKKRVEEQEGVLREQAHKMLKGSYKSMDELRGTEKLKRKIKKEQKQISQKQKDLSRRAPALFGSKH